MVTHTFDNGIHPRDCRNDEPFVDELDMPPRAYFNIPVDLIGSFIVVVAHRIKSGPFKTKKEAEDFSKVAVARVRQELLTLGGGIIWWRTRPQVENAEEPGMWQLYGRCATSPRLPDTFWADMGERI